MRVESFGAMFPIHLLFTKPVENLEIGEFSGTLSDSILELAFCWIMSKKLTA